MGYTSLYCPNCKKIQKSPVVPLYKLKKPKGRRWRGVNYSDVQWFLRGRQCEFCKENFLTAELDYNLVEELLDLRERIADKNKAIVVNLRKKKSFLTRAETVPKELAIGIIRASAWWDTHPSGPVKAPGHANNIYKSSLGWAVDFGANTFLVGLALERSIKLINRYLDEFSEGKLPKFDKLSEDLNFEIRGSVANYNGYEYKGYYPVNDGCMIFGGHSIMLNSATKYIIDQMGIMEIFK
jgi:hypothetical protein